VQVPRPGLGDGKTPQYLLIYGSPAEIPWAVQYALNMSTYVGRLDLEGPALETVELRQLIRQMGVANPLWGAPRIHGELLELGIDVGQTSVAKYMVRSRVPPSQGWRTFLRNHA
jgi:hypothetical protein